MEVKTIAVAEEDLSRIWSPKQILVGSLFGGYLCGFYLVSQNYKALGYPQLAKKAVAAAVASLILICSFIFIPEELSWQSAFFFIFALGILAGGYLSCEHYKAFLNKNFYIQAFILVPLIAFAILTIPFYVSEKLINEIPKMMVSLLPALLVSGYAESHQQVHLKILMENGTKKNSFGRLMGITSLALLIQVGLVSAIAFLSAFIFP